VKYKSLVKEGFASKITRYQDQSVIKTTYFLGRKKPRFQCNLLSPSQPPR